MSMISISLSLGLVYSIYLMIIPYRLLIYYPTHHIVYIYLYIYITNLSDVFDIIFNARLKHVDFLAYNILCLFEGIKLERYIL